jgi:hypothetical protein
MIHRVTVFQPRPRTALASWAASVGMATDAASRRRHLESAPVTADNGVPRCKSKSIVAAPLGPQGEPVADIIFNES